MFIVQLFKNLFCSLTHYHTMPNFEALKVYSSENIVRKGEIACTKQFLLFTQCFLPYMALIFHFKCAFEMSSAICFSLNQSKILSSDNGLNDNPMVYK